MSNLPEWTLISLPIAAAALLVGSALAARAAKVLPAAKGDWRSVTYLLLIHLLEPWLTVPWILLICPRLLDVLGMGRPLFSIILTLPMLLLLLPWAKRRWSIPEAKNLAFLLGRYGLIRFVITTAMWGASSNLGFVMSAFIGTALLWVNIIHLWRVILGTQRWLAVQEAQLQQMQLWTQRGSQPAAGCARSRPMI